MSINEANIQEYLSNSKTLVLATINSNSEPILRTIGGFGIKDNVIYFATAKGSEKTKQLEKNPQVSLLFQHENQDLATFTNVAVNGTVKNHESLEDFNKALSIILARRPQSKASYETHYIYSVKPSLVKILDFSKEKPEEKVTVKVSLS